VITGKQDWIKMREVMIGNKGQEERMENVKSKKNASSVVNCRVCELAIAL
jgi:hypothetical protein